MFEAVAVIGGDVDVGVEIEAIKIGLWVRLEVTHGMPGLRPICSTRAPARGLRALRPWTVHS